MKIFNKKIDLTYIPYIGWRIERAIYEIRYFFQKLFRGYSDREIYNLNTELVKWLHKRIPIFRKWSDGFPAMRVTEEEWEDILKEIEFACKHYSYLHIDDIDDDGDNDTKENYERMEKGFELLGKYIEDLWL